MIALKKQNLRNQAFSAFISGSNQMIKATAMTLEEYENGDSMIALFIREGEVV